MTIVIDQMTAELERISGLDPAEAAKPGSDLADRLAALLDDDEEER
jgi:hypothetical protein